MRDNRGHLLIHLYRQISKPPFGRVKCSNSLTYHNPFIQKTVWQPKPWLETFNLGLTHFQTGP